MANGSVSAMISYLGVSQSYIGAHNVMSVKYVWCKFLATQYLSHLNYKGK